MPVSLPSRHEGETVVEPHMLDGNRVVMDGAQTFAKTAHIEAIRMSAPFHVMTAHGRVTGQAGDWLARNPTTGERWPILEADFAANYQEVVPDGTDP